MSARGRASQTEANLLPESIADSRRHLVILTLTAAIALLCAVGPERAQAHAGGALAAPGRTASRARNARARTERRSAGSRRCRRAPLATGRCVRSARLERRRRHTSRGSDRHGAELESDVAAASPAGAGELAVAPPPGAAGEPCLGSELVPSAANIAQVREATLCLINEQREQHGELPLTENPRLQTAAQGHSEDMVARDYFEHTTPSGEAFSTRILATGYVPRGSAYELGENIDVATLSLTTPAATVTAWMNSPEHRANILNGEFRETGVGIAPSAPAYFAEGQPGATYTQDFGVLAS